MFVIGHCTVLQGTVIDARGSIIGVQDEAAPGKGKIRLPVHKWEEAGSFFSAPSQIELSSIEAGPDGLTIDFNQLLLVCGRVAQGFLHGAQAPSFINPTRSTRQWTAAAHRPERQP